MASFWKSPSEIFLAILQEAEKIIGGESVVDLIARCKEMLKLEDLAWSTSDQSPEDRPVYEARLAAWRSKIDEAQVGVHRLMMAQAVGGNWFAVGYRSIEAGEEVIPRRYWPFLTLDLEHATAKGEAGEFRAVRCAFQKDVPADHPIRARVRVANSVSTAAGQPPKLQASRKRGPEPKQLMRVKTEMLRLDRSVLNGMKEEQMVAEFNASRDTCRRARKELSELH